MDYSSEEGCSYLTTIVRGYEQVDKRRLCHQTLARLHRAGHSVLRRRKQAGFSTMLQFTHLMVNMQYRRDAGITMVDFADRNYGGTADECQQRPQRRRKGVNGL